MVDKIQNRCMAKLTDHVVEKIVLDNQTTSLANHDPDQLRRIAEQRIHKMLPDFHTPVHPTYAFMIHRAITELKTEGGSDKESISKFIRLEYDDLPLAHESVLKFQLNKLCEKGEIVLSELGCYMLPAGIGIGIVLEKQVLKQSDELKVEKKGGRGGGSRVESNKFNENEADVELQKVNVTSKEMKGKKQNGKAGVRPGCRWSRRLKFSKPPEEERDEHINKHVEVLAQIGGDANGDQRYHTESSIADHQFKDEIFAVFGEPLEPPGYPSKKDQLIKLKQQTQADLQAFGIVVEAKQKQADNDEELQLQAPAREFAHDVSRPNHVHPELPDLINAGVAVGALLSSDQGKPETEHSDTILKLSTVMELSPMLVEDTFYQSVIKPIAPMVQEDQLTLSAEVDAMPAKPGPEACSKGIVICLPSYDQHPKKHQIPVHRGRGRPHKMTPNSGLMVTEKPKKKQGRGRPRKQKPGDLPESEANVEVETTARRATAQWDWEVVSTPAVYENSNSGNDTTLASESASQDKETTNKRKRIGRPPKIDRHEHRESMDSPKVKRGRGKGCNSISYTDISITDLVYSQDHHLQPMSRIRGRPRKL
ncbi:hypothetical protein QQ045_018303 [Rhodiola kirilowii]